MNWRGGGGLQRLQPLLLLDGVDHETARLHLAQAAASLADTCLYVCFIGLIVYVFNTLFCGDFG